MHVAYEINQVTKKKYKVVVVPCANCGEPVKCSGKRPWRTSLDQAKAGKACCTQECVEALRRKFWKQGGEFLAEYNKTFGRMHKLQENPMKRPDVVNKMIESKRKNGTLRQTPKSRGGNGRGLTSTQKMLADALNWPTEVAVKTAPHLPPGRRRAYQKTQGYPTCYKVDIANPSLKIAVEVDGASHNGRRAAMDQKKTECLRGLGWKVLHLSNKQIEADLAGSVRTVLSIT